jgi:hypothetical protein
MTAQAPTTNITKIALPSTLSAEPLLFVKLAREIASDLRPLPDILMHHGVSDEDWGRISANPTFQRYLRSSIEEWNGVSNTPERVRIKAIAFVEEWLPELYARGHDAKEPLSAKVELLKTMSKMGGVGGIEAVGGGGDRMIVQINLGADHKLEFAKDITPKSGTE